MQEPPDVDVYKMTAERYAGFIARFREYFGIPLQADLETLDEVFSQVAEEYHRLRINRIKNGM